jgi:GTPase SAR1 family protein
MFITFIIGMAGSGKSFLTAALSDWLKMQKQKIATVNLDPGATNLPYTPDIDIRDYIRTEDIMETYGLGPNGALILASDLVADQIEEVGKEVEEINPDLVIVDTAGQMELFAFRASGPFITHELTKNPKAIIYLFDAPFCLNPLNYISNLFLSAAVFTRFFIPQVHVLSKCDLVLEKEKNQIVDWSVKPKKLEAAVDKKLQGTGRLFGRNLIHAIYGLGLRFPLIPVSSRTNEGLVNLNIALERILSVGEKFTY